MTGQDGIGARESCLKRGGKRRPYAIRCGNHDMAHDRPESPDAGEFTPPLARLVHTEQSTRDARRHAVPLA